MSIGDLLSNLGVLTSASNLPGSPWTYYVPGTTMEIDIIYVQVVLVSEVEVLGCLLNAANEVIRHLSTAGSVFINAPELAWDAETVRLRLNPGPQMTWLEWGRTIEGLAHFLDLYDPIAILFQTRDHAIEASLGSGAIFNIFNTSPEK